MKKLVVTMLTLLSCGSAYALPVGNPAEASLFLTGAWWNGYCCDPCDPCFNWCDAWSFRLGYYGDFVFNRHLALDEEGSETGSKIDTTEMTTNAAYLALNICDRVDVFATLGATNFHITTDAISFFSLPFESELFFNSDFSWSVGGRATLWQCDCLLVGIEGQYFQAQPRLDSLLRYDTGTLTYFNNNSDAEYREWQVGLGIAYHFATSCPSIAMTPYAALTWSGSRFDIGNATLEVLPGLNEGFAPLANDKLWGFAVGTSLNLFDLLGVTVEGRWANEKALYVNGQFRF